MEHGAQVDGAGEQLHFWRKRVRKVTQQALANEIDSSPGNLSRVENGTENLGFDKWRKAAKFLDVPFGVLVDPSIPYAMLSGLLTGVGKWTRKSPMVEAEDVKPVLRPVPVNPVWSKIPEAPVAFGNGNDMLFCGHSTEPLEPRRRYVVLRAFMIDDEPHFELAVREFFRDVAANVPNDLERAATLGTPVSTKKSNAFTNALSTAAALRRLFVEGWFAADEDATADPHLYHQIVPLSDSSILTHWPLVAAFQFVS